MLRGCHCCYYKYCQLLLGLQISRYSRETGRRLHMREKKRKKAEDNYSFSISVLQSMTQQKHHSLETSDHRFHALGEMLPHSLTLAGVHL
ncbi:Kinesin Heavy Chain Isoform 5C [Manis pentadactyla]|nr:Kinesin Heavy Chain Isoform 5C [Manis pentadactyla]